MGPLSARAQPAMPVIGFMSGRSPEVRRRAFADSGKPRGESKFPAMGHISDPLVGKRQGCCFELSRRLSLSALLLAFDRFLRAGPPLR